jgi:hypothetical protein
MAMLLSTGCCDLWNTSIFVTVLSETVPSMLKNFPFLFYGLFFFVLKNSAKDVTVINNNNSAATQKLDSLFESSVRRNLHEGPCKNLN